MNTVRHILQVKGDLVWSIRPEATVFEALRLMADKDIGALPVIQDDKIIGILSERDYARKVILQGKTSKDTAVREIMTERIYTIHPDQTVEEAMDVMVRHDVRHLPVMDDNQLIGIISIMDVVRMVIHTQRQTIKDLERRVLST